jgi:peptidoglycan/xylan/chitin deacetylase (PgdA/CDA1 family)
MISPKITGAIITIIIVVIGVVLIYPALRLDSHVVQNQVLLTFNIINSTNLPTWCNDLSRFLQDNNIHSTVFITGNMAETYPSCVTGFGKNSDVGSMTYSYDTITGLNYTGQFSKIQQGKAAVDEQGKLNSTIFRAPQGAVDDKIYSILTRLHILGDFNYKDHYNIYTNGPSGKIFYRFPMTSLDNISDSKLPGRDPNIPLMVNIYNYDSIKKVQEFINSASKNPHQFVTASELIRNTVR